MEIIYTWSEVPSTIRMEKDMQLVCTCEVADCGNGMAGTVMGVLAFEGEKWRRLDSNLAL